MAVSRRLRFEILKRDNHTCRYCGQRPPDVALTVDHVRPVALGGSDDPTNERDAIQDVLDQVDEAWCGWGVPDGTERRTLPRPHGWVDSVERFFAAGVPVDEMVRFVGVAMRKAIREDGNRSPISQEQIWRYFCGCCWRTLDDLAERAADLIAVEDGSDPEKHIESEALRDGA